MIRKSKIYLRGAYGPGNLGDDVLLFCMLKILKPLVKENEISVSVKNLKLAKSINNNVVWVPLNSPVFSDLTILGGGGQFFSFKTNNLKQNKKQNPLKFLKNKFREGYTIVDLIVGYSLRRFFGIGFKTKKLALFCVGVGPFENGTDNEYFRAYSLLKKANFISVRDVDSQLEVQNMFGFKSHLFVDITLNRDLWYDSKNDYLKKHDINEKPLVGIILRDWKLNSSGFETMRKLLDFEQQNPQYEYVYISLYKEYDRKIINKLNKRNNLIWDPISFTINEFITKLKKCDVIVSTRAHGVLLPTMAYIPSIAVEIEPKLLAVHRMMPLSTQLLSNDRFNDLNKKIQLCLNYNDSFIKNVNEDLANNSLLAKESIEKLYNWCKDVKK